MIGVAPSRRTLAAAAALGAVALGAVLAGGAAWPVWALGWVVLGVLFAIDAARLPDRARFRVALRAPAELHPGVPVRAEAEVHLPAARRIVAQVALDAAGCLEPLAPLEVAVAGGAGTCAVTMRAARRGRAKVEAAWLRCSGPWGLARGAARVAVDFDVPVVPDLGPVRRDAIRFFRERDVRAGLKIERYRGDGTEFDSLREFVRGDDHRLVHWKASARHGALLSRQFRAERNHQVVLAVDSGRLMGEPAGDLTRLDYALRAALLLGFVALASGDRVGAYSFGAQAGPLLEPAGGLGAFPRLTRWSSDVDERAEETNFTLGLATLAGRLRQRSLVVVMTEFVDSISAELMVQNLGLLARRHVVLFVALRDTSLPAIAGARPATPHAVHRAVLAEGLLDERDAVLRRLSRLGIGLVDAWPDEAGPHLVQRYLDVRRRERI